MSDSLEQYAIGHFGFSAVHPDNLGASEYTLVGIAADHSGSIKGFQHELEQCLKNCVKACQVSPRADNLLLRFTRFSKQVHEVHGFKPLENINLGDYDDSLKPHLDTSLFDAILDCIESISHYGEELHKQDFSANAILFIVTDGRDNYSQHSPSAIRQALEALVAKECLESIITVLIGVNIDKPLVADALQAVREDCGFTKYIATKDASPESLAKIAEFVSRSISNQSKALPDAASKTASNPGSRLIEW